jgi:hypothetical protein
VFSIESVLYRMCSLENAYACVSIDRRLPERERGSTRGGRGLLTIENTFYREHILSGL